MEDLKFDMKSFESLPHRLGAIGRKLPISL